MGFDYRLCACILAVLLFCIAGCILIISSIRHTNKRLVGSAMTVDCTKEIAGKHASIVCEIRDVRQLLRCLLMNELVVAPAEIDAFITALVNGTVEVEEIPWIEIDDVFDADPFGADTFGANPFGDDITFDGFMFGGVPPKKRGMASVNRITVMRPDGTIDHQLRLDNRGRIISEHGVNRNGKLVLQSIRNETIKVHHPYIMLCRDLLRQGINSFVLSKQGMAADPSIRVGVRRDCTGALDEMKELKYHSEILIIIQCVLNNGWNVHATERDIPAGGHIGAIEVYGFFKMLRFCINSGFQGFRTGSGISARAPFATNPDRIDESETYIIRDSTNYNAVLGEHRRIEAAIDGFCDAGSDIATIVHGVRGDLPVNISVQLQ